MQNPHFVGRAAVKKAHEHTIYPYEIAAVFKYHIPLHHVSGWQRALKHSFVAMYK